MEMVLQAFEYETLPGGDQGHQPSGGHPGMLEEFFTSVKGRSYASC